MDETAISLKHVFALPEGKLPAGARAVVASRASTSPLRENLLKEARGIKWGLVSDEILEKVGDALDIPVIRILIRAWEKYRSVVQYADPEKYPPNETYLVPLAEHTVKSEHHPYIEVLVGERSVGKIVFDVTVSLSLKAFQLKIRDARIRAIETGSCEGKGTIALGQALLVERALTPIPLPGHIDLGEGICLREPQAPR